MAKSSVTEVRTTQGFDFIRELGQQLRVDSIRSSTTAGSGHPTSSMSAADLMAVLITRYFLYDWNEAVGVITDDEMLTFRKFGSRLQGHPTPALPWVDVATGSLGQGLPIAVGVALAGRKLDQLPYHVWTLTGDSELTEGSIWEGLDKAGYYGLANFTAIFDINRLGQRGPTEYEWETDHYRDRVQAFGCRAIVIDGHDLEQVDQALAQAREATGKPTVVIARTVKGKGFREIENKDGWHGKALPSDMAERAMLGGVRHLRIDGLKPEPGEPAIKDGNVTVTLPTYKKGDKVATRKAYGDALKALGARPTVVAMDGEVSNSTFAEEFAKAYPERYFEMFIAEQQLVATAVGMSVRHYIPFASTFAAFLSRAYDFIRMAAISEANIRLCGSHAGVEIGEDGPSQMALEDLAAMRAVHGSTVLYPSDATSTALLVKAMADQQGISYIRTTRGAYPVLYEDGAEFHIGGSKLVRSDPNDRVTLIGAGVTLHNCLAAADDLEREGIKSRVIDLYSVKPVDRKTLQEAAALTRGRMIVVEDHYPEGGLGAAVMEALAADMDPPRIVHLAVRHLPGSGKPAELMDKAEISARHIVAAAKRLYGL
ncbi:MAG: transketolase [Chloroflexi bacterium]|nr:MAG: transketolase [Chloroflexota bacterium]